MNYLSNVNPGIDQIAPYQPGKPIETLERELGITDSVKLASNENPLGPSPRVMRDLPSQLAQLARYPCLLYTSPSPRDRTRSRMPSSA